MPQYQYYRIELHMLRLTGYIHIRADGTALATYINDKDGVSETEDLSKTYQITDNERGSFLSEHGRTLNEIIPISEKEYLTAIGTI